MPPLEAAIPERLRPAIEACATGAVPANIGLLRLLMEARTASETDEALTAASRSTNDPAERLRLEAARRLLAENPQAFGLVKSVLRDVEHGGTAPDPDVGVAHWAGTFDRMARASPEGAVALYALGNPDLLRAATGEVVAYLRNEGLTGPRARVLEIGCGIGRFVQALAPEVAHVTGLDIAHRMIEEAKRRCGGLANVSLHVSSGRDLALMEDRSIDLILAADVFPYLVQAGADLVERHFGEAARVLAPGGSLVILNFSYRGDPARDTADIRRLASEHGLIVRTCGERPFEWWDASAFRLATAA